MKCTLSVFDKIFKNPTPNFFLPKQKIRAFDWWADHICDSFNFRCEKAAKVFCKMSQKVYPECPFDFRLSILTYFLDCSINTLTPITIECMCAGSPCKIDWFCYDGSCHEKQKGNSYKYLQHFLFFFETKISNIVCCPRP